MGAGGGGAMDSPFFLPPLPGASHLSLEEEDGEGGWEGQSVTESSKWVCLYFLVLMMLLLLLFLLSIFVAQTVFPSEPIIDFEKKEKEIENPSFQPQFKTGILFFFLSFLPLFLPFPPSPLPLSKANPISKSPFPPETVEE